MFFDEAVTSALSVGVQQVVIVGAGYDSRAWRLARPDVLFIEVDHPATQHDKRQRAPHGHAPVYVAADLEADRLSVVLPSVGFDSLKPAVFVVEGLTMYLPEATTKTMLSDLAAVSPPGSQLAINFTVQGGGSVSPISRAIAWATRTTWRARGEPTHGWVRPDELPNLLLETGWQVSDVVQAPTLAQRYLTGTQLRREGLNPGAICVAATHV